MQVGGSRGEGATYLLSSLLDAAREHDDGARAGLPAHAPEVVARAVQRALGTRRFYYLYHSVQMKTTAYDYRVLVLHIIIMEIFYKYSL